MSKQLVIVAGIHGCDDGDALGFVLRSKCWGSVLCEDLGGDMLWFNQVRSCHIFVCFFGLCIYIRVITAVCCMCVSMSSSINYMHCTCSSVLYCRVHSSQ